MVMETERNKDLKPTIVFNRDGEITGTEDNLSKTYESQIVDFLDFQPTKPQKNALEKIVSISRYFLQGLISGIPFRGFILEGEPASGKTYLATIAARKLARELKEDVELWIIDSSQIASPKWGEAEKRLVEIFSAVSESSTRRKKFLLFDDIDCLMVERGSTIAKEWHYALNSVLFHVIDRIDTNNIVFTATTNRPDLIDSALRSRLYSIEVGLPNPEELKDIARILLERSIDNFGDVNNETSYRVKAQLENDKEDLLESVYNKLEQISSQNSGNLSIREVEKITIETFIGTIVDIESALQLGLGGSR